MMPNLTPFEAAGLILILLCALTIYRAHRNAELPAFNIFDLFMENGKVSKLAFVFIGSWVSTTYVFVGTYLAGKMTETWYAVYGAMWVAPIIAKLFSGPPQPKENQSDKTS